MQRPDHLPDYTSPPLDEVVLGVQFSPIPGYNSVGSFGIWSIFKEEFPVVQEQAMLQPQFETFGGMNLQASFEFQIEPGPVGSRLWFVSNDDNRLVQFQQDRFLLNWRRRPNEQPYPHYEGIAEIFSEKLNLLDGFLFDATAQRLDINQAEATYINVIPVENFSEVGKWFRIWNGGYLNVESLNANFTEVVVDDEQRPFARFHHEIQSVFTTDGRHKAFRLSLTVRGKPMTAGMLGAMAFLGNARELIVNRFDAMTTDDAHKFWGKKK